MFIFSRIKIEVIMSDKPCLIHLSPEGPKADGLTQLDLEPAEFQSPLPVQNAHIFMRMQLLV